MSLNFCVFCSDQAHMLEHISKCPALVSGTLSQKPTFFQISEKGNLCKNCWCLFSPDDWLYHRKAQVCHKKKAVIKDRNLSPQHYARSSHVLANQKQSIINSSVLLFNSEGHHREPHAQRQSERVSTESVQTHQSQMMKIATSILSPLVRQWVNRHSHVDTNVLVVYLTSAVVEFGTTFLAKPIIVPTWQVIQKINKSINWVPILQRPQNLFNQRFLDLKLSKMSSNRQSKVIKGLNKLSKLYPGLVRKRDLPQVCRRIHRFRSFVNIKDILVLIKSLFQCRRRNTTHFALDLYVILLSGQRFLADQHRIQQGLMNLLASNKEKLQSQYDLTFSMIIGKTGVQQEVCLNLQLCILLKEFNWPGFHPKTTRLVRRMNEWLGVQAYSFKDAILNAAAIVSTDLGLSQRISGHRSITNTRRYTRALAIGDNLKVTSRLIVPGLKSRYGNIDESEVAQYFDSLILPNVRYASFRQDWLHELLGRLYTTRYKHQFENDISIDFMKEQQIREEHQVENNPLQENLVIVERLQDDQQQEKDNQIQCSQDQEDVRRRVTIYGCAMKFVNKSFCKSDFFQNVIGYEELRCEICHYKILSGDLRLRCIYCSGSSHIDCVNIMCSCSQSTISTISPTVSIDKSIQFQKSSESVLMPAEYKRSMTNEELQIRILLAIRCFRYTRVPILACGYKVHFPDNYWRGVSQLVLPDYDSYISGSYFPPIEALPIPEYSDHAVFGTQWGLFATAQIPKNVFIGEYACDLLNGRDLVVCKKYDSMMIYSSANSPSDVYLAPKDYAGYVTLINTGNKQDINCHTLRVIINGSLRVILLTKTIIKKGQELLYSYGQSYKFTAK